MRNVYRASTVQEAWFELLPAQQSPHARRVLALVQEQGPELMPVVKWGALVLLKGHFHAFAIAPYRRSLHLQVFNGASLMGRFPMLGGGGSGMRVLQMRYSQGIDEDLVRDLVRAALDGWPRERA